MFARRRWPLLPTILLLASLLIPATAGAAPPMPAGTSEQIAAGDWFDLSMAVDSTGAVHIAAVQAALHASRLVYLTDRSGAWVQRLVHRLDDAATDGATWSAPSLALDENDRVSIIAVGGDAREHLGVVAGAARDAGDRVAQARGGPLDEADHPRVEVDRVEAHQVRQRDLQSVGRCQLVDMSTEGGLHGDERGVPMMATPFMT